MSGPYQLSNSTLVIAKRYQEILTAAKVTLGLQDVWFGDQSIVPRTPAVCIEPGLKRRNFDGVPDMTMMNIDTIILLYHSQVIVNGGQQQARSDAITFAEDIEEFLHVNHPRLFNATATQQLTIQGFCTDFDPGYSYKSRSLYHAVQMTWTNLTKVSLQRVT